MKNYTYIRKKEEYQDSGDIQVIYAISQDIEEMEMADTYDRFGQAIDAGEAGNSVTLLSEKAVRFANQNSENEYSLYDVLSAYDADEMYQKIIDSSELKEDEDYEVFAEKVKGFNYWDGSNYQSVLIYAEHSEVEWEEVEGEEAQLLEEEIEEKEYIKDGFGKNLYESEKYWIVYNYCQGSFSSYELFLKEEYELEDIF